MYRKIMLSSLVTLATTFVTGSANADICIPGVGCVSPGGVNPTFNSFNVYVHNWSGHPLKVRVRYYVGPQDVTCIGDNPSCNDGWADQTWDFDPIEEALILDNVKGRNIYFSAKATDGSGYVWDEKEVDMGRFYTNFTYKFQM